MSPARTRAGIVVSGVVQGVGFRFYTISIARRLRLAGWVRNLPDGRVAAEAEGDPGMVDVFVEELKIGPPAAHVSAVSVTVIPVTGDIPPFVLRY